MKWGEKIERWFGHAGHPSKISKTGKIELGSLSMLRIQKVCDDLGEESDVEAIEMLMENGMDDEEIEEVVKATNILSSNIIGDLDLEVEKMFAQGILDKYGFQGIDQFNEQLNQYRETHPHHQGK